MSFQSSVDHLRPCKYLKRQFVKCIAHSGIRRKLLCLTLMLALLSTPGLSITWQQTPVVAAALVTSTTYWSHSFGAFLKRLFSSRTSKPQETTETRSSGVRSIRINPGRQVVYLFQRIPFTAVAFNSLGDLQQGVKFIWSSSDEAKLQINDAGQATASSPGLVWVKASTAFASSSVPVLIRPGSRPIQTDIEWEHDQNQLRPDGTLT